MTALTLTSTERRDLRAQAHHLEPVVMIGGDGLTAAVTKETDAALKAHGLIKVRALLDDREARAAAMLALCEQLGAAPVQQIGKLLVLWRPVPPKPKAERDPAANPRPRLVKIVEASKSANRRPTVKRVNLLGNQRVTPGGLVKRAKPKQRSTKK